MEDHIPQTNNSLQLSPENPNFALPFVPGNPFNKSTAKIKNMKQNLHPESYRLVVFRDMSNGTSFLTRSSANSRETIKWEDGNEYPLIKLEISNTSHPFFTGKNMLVDTAGRIDKFKKRYEKKS
jgi:large subunit ribosomal protein L31